jgi:hypothetical protein
MAVPFDPQRLAVTGAAVPVVEGVAQSNFNGDAQYSLSATGYRWSMFRGVFRRPNSRWYGSIAMGQSSLWPPMCTPTGNRGFPPTVGGWP